MDLCLFDNTEEEAEEEQFENITVIEQDIEEDIEETIQESEKSLCRQRHLPFPCATPKGIWQRIYQYDLAMLHFYKKTEQCEIIPHGISSLEFLKKFVYPYLIPAFEKMCLLALRKEFTINPRQIFECLDCIAEILYNTNPNRPKKWKWKPIYIIFKDRDFLKKYARPVYPLHYVLTPNEAATMIQALIRGYLCRKHLDLEFLRKERRKREMINKCDYLRKGSLKRFE